MNDKTRIFFVRHGEAEHNAKSLIGGQTNFLLTDKGRQQALQAKDKLKNIKFDVVYSSPSARALETAEIITGQPVPLKNRLEELKERSFGSLEGKAEAQLESGRIIKDELDEAEAWHFKHIPDMESDHEVSERLIKALTKLASQHRGKTLLVAGHGGALRTALMRLNGIRGRFTKPGSIKNAEVVELGFVNGKLTALNLNGNPIDP